MKTYQKFIKTLCLLCLSLTAIGQTCLPSGITITTQAQIDAFATNYPGCTEILGDLIIADPTFYNITSLVGLSQITTVRGHLEVTKNRALTSLQGLHNITSITNDNNNAKLHIKNCDNLSNMQALSGITTVQGSLNIIYNDELTNLTGLHNITTVGGYIQVGECDKITDVSELSNITAVPGGLYLAFNDLLTNLSGLENITTVGGLQVLDCPLLSDISGLSNITSVIGEAELDILRIAKLPVTNLNALSNITTLNTRLSIDDNNNLTDISGLSNLTTLQRHSLNIDQNPLLTTLSGLENIAPTSISSIRITNNAMLSTCEVSSVCGYIDNNLNIATISGNATNCVSEAAIQAACPLPIELAAFEVKSENNHTANLSWTTLTEINNDYFKVLHSTDGLDFELIGTVKGQGTSFEAQEYSFTHENLSGGQHYYQLEQVDFDEQSSLSPIESILMPKLQGDIRVFPNPTTDVLHISGDIAENARISIVNTLGKTVRQKTLSGSVINLMDLEAGVYFISIHSNEEMIIKKVIKSDL